MNSRLYSGRVWHTRTEPAYTFRYRVWYLCLDLAETEQVTKRLRPFSHNRHNLLSFWDRDYLRSTEASQPESRPGERIELLTVPRLLGHAFNPVSFFLHRTGGRITHVAAEVHNTWHERHVYELEPREPDAAAYVSETPKAFYVSPFLPMTGRYRFELQEREDERLLVSIESYDEAGVRLFAGGIDVRPLPLTQANLVRLLLTMPFINLKTVAMIHWQGFKIWRRGVKFRRNPSRERRRDGVATGRR